MVFGLALVLALLFGIATMALGATGDNFLLGKANSAGAVSKLTANIANPALQLVNTSTGAAATALNLNVASGNAPLKVNAGAGKATNLNADKLDGQEPTTIGREMWWAVINSDGTVLRGRGVNPFHTIKQGTGNYQVGFDRGVSNCAYTATTTNGAAGQTGVNPGNFSTDIKVFTVNSAGTPTDLAFHVIVAC
jgi:hypothetical protein